MISTDNDHDVYYLDTYKLGRCEILQNMRSAKRIFLRRTGAYVTESDLTTKCCVLKGGHLSATEQYWINE